MAESEAKSAALWLGKLLVEKVKYLGGVTGKVKTLQTQLITLAAFQMEAMKTRRQDARVQTALSQARSLAYDCEDVIDTYILKVARHGYDEFNEGCQLGCALWWACILREALSVYQIGSQIDDLNAKISILKTDLVSYGVTTRISQDDIPGTSSLSRVYPHEIEERIVVGLERDVEELVGRLMDPTDKTVIAISGMGGLGKSTLAAELYRHPVIREGGYFQAFGWAHVTQRLQPGKVLETILNSLVDENDHDGRARIKQEVKADRGHEALYNMMRRKRCVVVVDDIWTSEDWNKLEAAFPRRSGTGSRVILTTRYQGILLSSSVSLDQDQVHLHPIQGLDNVNSWELFQKTVFPGRICTDDIKERLGREIIRHCKGVPLAIVVLGRALKWKESIEEWKQMHDNISAQIKEGGAPHTPYKEVYDVLQVSYDELPYHLKHCFLHLANFPEDDEFRANRLYHLWAGEGIVIKEQSNDRSEEEEEIGERYLEELVSRNMVQVEKRWVNGRILIFRMHDLMRDVCMDIAKREGFFQTVNCQSLVSFRETLPPARDNRLRSLAVYMSTEHQNSILPHTIAANVPSRAPNLRSLILFPIGKQREEVDCTKLMETICKDYPLLRVFDCQRLNMTGKLPKKLGNLIHLRYLSLQGTRITELSTSIEKLQSLHTLDLYVDDVVENLVIPNVLWKMKQLTHVYLPQAKGMRKMIEGEGRTTAADLQSYTIKDGGELRLKGLCNLHTLTFIDLDRIDLKDLSNLESLRCINGTCESSKEFLRLLLQWPSINRFFLRVHVEILNEDPLTLSRCQVLNNLELYSEPYAGIHLRQPLQLPNSLFQIHIWYVQLVEDPLPVLEKLPNLERLGLHMCYDGQKMACSSLGFPRLASLYFEGLPCFSEWEVEHGAVQKLKVLVIRECVLREVPDAIPNSANVRIRNSLAT